MRFKGKTVIVTGGASGIGLATTKRFFSEGGNVVMADINPARLQQAKDEIVKTPGGAVEISVCDVSSEHQVAATVQLAIQKFGGVNVIVNNAGLMIFKKIEDHSGDDWLRILSVDLLGAFYFTKHAFMNMPNGGAIINVSSIHAVETEPMVASYAAAKAALLSLTRSSCLEGKPKGIRVNAILPGAIDTPMLWDNPNVKSGVEHIDKQDVGKPEDIAATIAFLASDDAAFIEGAMIRVDGGRLDRL